MLNRCYILDSAPAPWGDYGEMLTHGMATISAEGVVQLERTGPFIPPISFPGMVPIVTQALREELELSGLTGFSFGPVVKQRIVQLDWHLWDRTRPDPKKYPFEGEPEYYIECEKHSPAAAEAVGELWALWIPKIARVKRDQRIVESRSQLHLVASTMKSSDFAGSDDVGFYFVSEKAKAWLEARVREWVAFEEASLADEVAADTNGKRGKAKKEQKE